MLRRVKVDGDTLLTTLCQAEAIVNSRPLAQLSSEPRDPSTVTPAQLVTGRNLLTLPDDLSTDDKKDNSAVRWHERQCHQAELWTRWVREYLMTLQPFSKWLAQGREPKVGEKVLMGEVNTR